MDIVNRVTSHECIQVGLAMGWGGWGSSSLPSWGEVTPSLSSSPSFVGGHEGGDSTLGKWVHVSETVRARETER